MKHIILAVLFSLTTSFFAFCQVDYYKDVRECEAFLFNNQKADYVKSCHLLFKKWGVKQMDDWWNAMLISEQIYSPYTDSIILLLNDKKGLFLLNPNKIEFNDYPTLELYLDTLNNKRGRHFLSLKKEKRKEWEVLERKDQFPRSWFAKLFISNNKLRKIDAANRAEFLSLYKQNNSSLPTKIELGTNELVAPYFVIFQHSNLSWLSPKSELDSVLVKEIKKGNISPKTFQFSVVYSVFRAIGENKVSEYKSGDNFIHHWFSISDKKNLNEIYLTVTKTQLIFINKIRNYLSLESISDTFLKKRAYFIKLGLNVR